MNAWCDVFSHFVAVGTLSVLVFSAIDYVFSCVQCVLLVDWRCPKHVEHRRSEIKLNKL